LQVGMRLEGIITNVANFGAFVDIGVHQDGLIHVSQLADRFISDPKEVVKVGQVVNVRVLEVNAGLKRISLSMRSESNRLEETGPKSGIPKSTSSKSTSSKSTSPNNTHPSANNKPATLDDLQARFGKKR
jgi:protein Tex